MTYLYYHFCTPCNNQKEKCPSAAPLHRWDIGAWREHILCTRSGRKEWVYGRDRIYARQPSLEYMFLPPWCLELWEHMPHGPLPMPHYSILYAHRAVGKKKRIGPCVRRLLRKIREGFPEMWLWLHLENEGGHSGQEDCFQGPAGSQSYKCMPIWRTVGGMFVLG